MRNLFSTILMWILLILLFVGLLYFVVKLAIILLFISLFVWWIITAVGFLDKK